MMKGKVITYASRQLKVNEKNYPNQDFELATVMFMLKLWCQYFYGVYCEIFFDDHILQYFSTQ